MKKRILVTILAFVLLISAILIPAIVSTEKTEAAAYTEYRYFHLDTTNKIGYIGENGWADFAKFINKDELYQDGSSSVETLENDYGEGYIFYLVGDVTVEWGTGSLKEFRGKLTGNLNTVTFAYSGTSGTAVDFSKGLLTNSALLSSGKAYLGGLVGYLNGGTLQLLNFTFTNNAETVIYLDASGFDDVDPTDTAGDGNDIYDSLYIGGLVGYMENGAKIEKVSSLCGAVKFSETTIRGVSTDKCNERTDYYVGGVVGGSGGGSVTEVWSGFDIGVSLVYSDNHYSYVNNTASDYISGDANENYYDVFAGGIVGVCKSGTAIKDCYTNALVSASGNDSQSTNNSSPISRLIFGQEVLAGGIAGSCENSSSNTISSCAVASPVVSAICYQQAFDNAYILEYISNIFNYMSLQNCCRTLAPQYVRYDGKSSSAAIANNMTNTSVPSNVFMTSAVLGGASSNNIAMVNSYSYFSTGTSGSCYTTSAGPVSNSTYVISDLNSSAAVSALNGSTTRSIWALSTTGKLTMSWFAPLPQDPTISWTSGASDGTITVRGISSDLYDSVKLYFKVLFYTQGKFGKATGASVSAGATSVDGVNLRLYPADSAGKIAESDYENYIELSDTEPTKLETGGYYRVAAELEGTNLDSLTTSNVTVELSAQDSAHNVYLTNRTDGKPDGFFDLSSGLTISTTESYDVTISAKVTVTISGASTTKSITRQIKLIPSITGIMPESSGSYTLPTTYGDSYGVYPGSTYLFNATARGITSMSGLVTWSLSGNSASGTSVNASTGVLTLASTERGTYNSTLQYNVLTLKVTTKGTDPTTKDFYLAVMNPLKSYTIACTPENLVEDSTASATFSISAGTYLYTYENVSGSAWNPTETPSLVSWQKKCPGESVFGSSTSAETYSVKDDIVLVGFIGNNMQKPVILGCLYPADAGFVNESFIKENTKRHYKFKQGFEYTETDESNKQGLTVASPKGLTEIIEDENETITLKDKNGKNLLKIDSKNGAVELTADKKITLKAGSCTITMDGQGGKVEIKADKISLAANQQVDVKGNTAVNLSGTQAKLEGQSMVEVKSGAMVQVSGSLIKLG